MIRTDFIELSLGIFWAVQNCANVRQEGEISDNRFWMGIFSQTLTKSIIKMGDLLCQLKKSIM